MTGRRILAAAALLGTALALSGCIAPPADFDVDDFLPTPEPAPSEPPWLPDDAALVLSGVATAGNGAVADLRMIVRGPSAFWADALSNEADLVTQAWCEGEVDQSVLQGQDYSFTTVEIEGAVRPGPEWPADAPISLHPLPTRDQTLAPASVTLEAVDEPVLPGQPASGIPHCLQPVLMPVPDVGRFVMGIAGDGASLNAWATREYGFTASLPGGLGTSPVEFSDCEASIIDQDPPEDWTTTFTTIGCVAHTE